MWRMALSGWQGQYGRRGGWLPVVACLAGALLPSLIGCGGGGGAVRDANGQVLGPTPTPSSNTAPDPNSPDAIPTGAPRVEASTPEGVSVFYYGNSSPGTTVPTFQMQVTVADVTKAQAQSAKVYIDGVGKRVADRRYLGSARWLLVVEPYFPPSDRWDLSLPIRVTYTAEDGTETDISTASDPKPTMIFFTTPPSP